MSNQVRPRELGDIVLTIVVFTLTCKSEGPAVEGVHTREHSDSLASFAISYCARPPHGPGFVDIEFVEEKIPSSAANGMLSLLRSASPFCGAPVDARIPDRSPG